MSAEAAVLETFDALYREACERRDAEAAFALWADEDDIAMWGSELPERAEGPAAVRALMAAIASSSNELAFRWDERRVRVEGDAAWVNATGTVSVSGTATPYRVTGVLVRRGGSWRWHTHNGSEPR